MAQTSIYRSYTENTPKTPNQVAASRHEKADKDANRMLLVAGAVGASALALIGYNNFTQPSVRTETVIVQAHETQSDVAKRAEREYGKDPGDFNINKEAYRLLHKYGDLHMGETVQVHVK